MDRFEPCELTFKVVVPTLNAGTDFRDFCEALRSAVDPSRVIVIDSESSDDTPRTARAAGFTVHSISRKDFNHGATRQLAVTLAPLTDITVFLTQDAFLADERAITLLLHPFRDPKVAAVYGRQLPQATANGIEAHARLFNYPPVSHCRSLSDRSRLGVKAAFFSNAFGAYRASALNAIGGFRDDLILGEDTVACAELLLAGFEVAYAADACVIHSHPYSLAQEFKRYFDIGVLHRRQQHLFSQFGTVEGEGGRFVHSELAYLSRTAPATIPSAVLRNLTKLLAFR